jgi:hypothetical protein
MGHQRLGRLPASRNLPEIIGLLLEGSAATDVLVDKVTRFCGEALGRALHDPAFIEALWLSVSVPKAAAADDFRGAMAELGVPVPDFPLPIDILVGFDAALENAQRQPGAAITDLSEMARQAGLSALAGLMDDRLPTLWDVCHEDVRVTLASFAAPQRFGDLAQRFFTNFVERIIHYFVDRAMNRYVGADQIAYSLGDIGGFDDAVRRHCDEATIIMRAFAKDWLAKNVLHEGRTISRQDCRSFAAYASRKIDTELMVRSGRDEAV